MLEVFLRTAGLRSLLWRAKITNPAGSQGPGASFPAVLARSINAQNVIDPG